MRHPYAVISYDEVRFAQRNPLIQSLGLSARRYAELNWLISHENITTFLKTIPAERQQRIYCEELVSAPQAVMMQLCAFLDIDVDGHMLKPYADPQERMTNGIHMQTAMTGDPKFHTHATIDRATATRWREQYTTDFLSDLTWEMAESLGYQRAELPARPYR